MTHLSAYRKSPEEICDYGVWLEPAKHLNYQRARYVHVHQGIAIDTDAHSFDTPSVSELEEWYGAFYTAVAGAKTRERFERLVAEWRGSVKAHSLEMKLALHPAYQRMIGMGAAALPFIFESLRSEPNEASQWFWALSSITEANPVPKESRGKMSEMTKAWLKWGHENGYVSLG